MYQCPDSTILAELRERIEKAWNTELPEAQVFNADDWEHDQVKKYLDGRPARNVDLSNPIMFSEMPLFGLLTDVGSRYYLQTYLLYALSPSDLPPGGTMSNHLPALFLIMQLNAKNGKQFLPSLSTAQREVIRDFMKLVSSHAEFFGVGDMSRALAQSVERWAEFVHK